MAKAILIMDMPKSCNECDVICMEYYSALHNGGLEILTIPSGCPLKEVPQKKKDKIGTNHQRYINGYNACIDEILKAGGENEID